jgi:non-heme chloroperoxidase
MPATPVVFIHGLWLHATSWAPWEQMFSGAGYSCLAPGWPGEPATVAAAREQPQLVAGTGIDALVEHYTQIIADLPDRPVLVGHSLGWLLVQRLLGQHLAAAAVAIDPAPIRGVIYLPPSALRVASVALRNPANRARAVALTPQQFRYGFGSAVGAAESDELFERWSVPSPARPLFELAAANLRRASPARVNTADSSRGPLLLMAGGRDHTVPASVTRATFSRYGRSAAVTGLRDWPDRGHSLTVDSGWEEVAAAAVAWLSDQEL